MQLFTLFAIAGQVAFGAAYHDALMKEPAPVLGLAARDDKCAELPALCTAPVMMHGTMTTMTYLCPKTTESAALVTVTTTKTVTANPTGSAAASSKGPDSGEPTTTTTIHSTATQYNTITITRKTRPTSDMTDSDSWIATVPIMSHRRSSQVSEVPVTTTAAATTSIGCHADEFCITHITPLTSRPMNSTISGVQFSPTISGSSFVKPTPHFRNFTTTEVNLYHFPTINLARHVNASDTAKPTPTGGASGQSSVSVVALFLGLMAVGYLA